MAVDVFADLTNRKFVASTKGGGEKPFASPFHQDKLYLNIQPLDYSSSGAASSSPYEVLDGSAFAISVLVTKTDGTTLAGPATSWSLTGTSMIGSIDLNTAAMATAFTSSSTLTVDGYVFIQFDDGANRKTTIQADITIKRSYITSGTPSELPVDSYLTRAECLALFARYVNENGATITLKSPDGTQEVVLGANNAGSAAANQST